MRLTQTEDVFALQAAMDKIMIDGTTDVLKSIKVAQLSLKHRKNK
jgi:hypothetical protein